MSNDTTRRDSYGTHDKIRQLAAEGKSAVQIAKAIRVSKSWVRSCAKQHGITLPPHKWPEAVTAEALRGHTGTDAELARSLGVTRAAVSLARRRHGVPLSLMPSVQRGILREVARRAGADADDAAHHEAMRSVMADLNVWADGAEGPEVES